MKPSTTIQKLLLQSVIFLIPSNLAYHFYTQSAFINGRLSDYLLPKLYLSDIPILLLDLIYLFNILHLNRCKRSFLVITTLIYFFSISLFSINPISSLWFVFKILELAIFGHYLVTSYTRHQFLSVITRPLVFSIILQLFVSFYQYINHSSFFGYFFLGEADLNSVGITHRVAGHQLIPYAYGTTAHPNVLAGFLVVGCLILAHTTKRTQSVSNLLTQKASLLLVISSFIIPFVLTESISALSGLSIVWLAYFALSKVSTHRIYSLVLMYTTITQVFSLLFYPLVYRSNLLSDNPSFSTRYELNSTALSLISHHPFVGIGPNLFSQYSSQSLIPGQQTYTLQPVHHGLLLIISETGIIGLVLVIIWLLKLQPAITNAKTPKSAFLPLIALATILVLDHYPLTLQTGQLLLLLSLVIILLKPDIES